MKNTTLIITVLIINLTNLVAQNDSLKLKMTIDSIKSNEEKWLHWAHGSPYLYPPRITESTISIVPEIQGLRNLYLSLGISKDLYSFYRKGVTTGTNAMIGIEYSPSQEIIAPKLSFSQSLFGIGYRINALYYIEPEINRMSIRPEVGFGYFRLRLMVGRNIFFQEYEDSKINKWTGSIRYHYPILPKRSKKYQ